MQEVAKAVPHLSDRALVGWRGYAPEGGTHKPHAWLSSLSLHVEELIGHANLGGYI